MKKSQIPILIAISLLVLTSPNIFSQEEGCNLPFNKNNKVEFQEVVSADSISKENLFDYILEWCATSYNNSTNVIRVNDRDVGKIILKGEEPTSYLLKGRGIKKGVLVKVRMSYTLIIDVKKNRYRYTLKNIIIVDPDANTDSPVENYVNWCVINDEVEAKFIRESTEAFKKMNRKPPKETKMIENLKYLQMNSLSMSSTTRGTCQSIINSLKVSVSEKINNKDEW